jgi:hypothetical protein
MTDTPQSLEEQLIQERWNVVLDIHQDYLQDFNFSKFEAKYGPRLDALEITPTTKPIEWNTRTAIEWYLGQLREICRDEPKANQYMERALSIDQATHSSFFITKEFLGQNLHELFRQTDRDQEWQRIYFDQRYVAEDGWHDPREFPGKLIFSDFVYERESYKGVRVALLMRSEKPNEKFKEIVGTITDPYVSIDGRVGAIFEMELPTGEKKQYNSNDMNMLRVREEGEKYADITSTLAREGFTEYNGVALIPAESELAVVIGDPRTHSFHTKHYIMLQARSFGTGSFALFTATANGQETTLNINDLSRTLHVRPKTN